MIKPSLPIVSASLLIAGLLTLPAPLRAQDEPKTPLAQEMSGIAKDFRALRKIVSDPSQKDAAVKLVKDMEDHATKAKGFDPIKTKDIPPADKDQFLADYHKQIDGLITDMQALEQAVNAGNSTQALTLMDKINGDKREGHHKFNAEDEQRGGNHPPGPPPAVQSSPQASPQ